ncbi:MAG TPA: hypothetical protein VHT27_07905 [Solirubrobacteraceae bacterium]|nr:hypothetical protein [Solirubrobacteraceae bacterium]
MSRSGWEWGNPTPQGRTLRAISFSGPVGYAVGEGGSALSTSDGGATWRGLSTGTSGAIEELEVLSPTALVIGGAGGCITRVSSDGGQTFKRIFNVAESGCPEPVAGFSFLSPSVGYLLLRDGSLEATTNGGATFGRRTALPGTPVSSTGGGAQGVAVHFSDATHGIAVTGDPAGGASAAYATADGGVSWTQLPLPPGARVTSLDFLADGHDAYAVGPGTLLRSTDGGATWSAEPIGSGNQLNSIDCATAMQCVLTLTSGSKLLVTSDGGATDTVTTAASALLYGAAYAGASRIVAVGEGGATVVSSDGGATYASVSADVGGQFTRLREAPEGLLSAAGSMGDIALSSDHGHSWRVIATQTAAQLIDTAFTSPSDGFALDSAGGLQQTLDGGASWQTLDPGTGGPARAVAAIGRVALLIGPRGVRRAVGGGRFEALTGPVVAGVPLSDYDRAGAAVFAFGAGTHALIRSTDAGASWKKVRLPLGDRRGRSSSSIRSVSFTSAASGVILDTAGRAWRTHDGGASWHELLGTGTGDGVQVSFSDPLHGFMTLGSFGDEGQDAYVLHTADGGRTWQPEEVTLGSIGGDALVTGSSQRAALLVAGLGPESIARLLFTTESGGEQPSAAGAAETLALSTPRTRLARRALRRARGLVVVDGTLSGAVGGERIVVSRRSLHGGSWQHQEVIAGANGGSFSTSWRISGSSVFVAQWAGDSGRPGLGSAALSVTVR